MISYTIPDPADCPNCGKPLNQITRFTDDGPALVSRECPECGPVGPVETAPASSVIACIGPGEAA